MFRMRCYVQDKSSCVGPQSVRSLINAGDDILHVNIGSGLATAHLASLTHGSDTVIYAFGITSDRHRKYVESKLDFLGARCILTPTIHSGGRVRVVGGGVGVGFFRSDARLPQTGQSLDV